ncbi:MAG: dephospho-CoA kinase [Chromatiales bacterium]|nr:dephospho-CoA kinase [Chromatiales bacterium]
MLKIALYGGAGSGKSSAAKLFAELGVPVIDADVIAKQLTTPGSPQLAQIVAAFGTEIINDNQLDRAALRKIIYADDNARIRLNNIMHPPIRAALGKYMANINATYCIVVVPLLIEAQMIDLVDYIVVIDCSEQTQIDRLIVRDNLTYDEAAKIVSIQATRKQRLEVCDQVIDNSRDIRYLKAQIDKFHKKWTQQLIRRKNLP